MAFTTNKENRLKIATILKKARNNLGHSQEAIAKVAHLNKNEITFYETGERALSEKRIPIISRAYQVSAVKLSRLAKNEPIFPQGENLIPIFALLVEAGIQDFSFDDIQILKEFEDEMGFALTSEQLLAWNNKRIESK